MTVDGFFVAKLQKTGPTPANATRANGNVEKGAHSFANETEIIDNKPITEEEEVDDFAEFEKEDDQEYILRAKRNAMRRRGLDPKALNKGKKPKETTEEGSEKTVEKTEEKAEKVEKKDEKKVEKKVEKKEVKKTEKKEVTKEVKEVKEAEKPKEAKKEKATKKKTAKK